MDKTEIYDAENLKFYPVVDVKDMDELMAIVMEDSFYRGFCASFTGDDKFRTDELFSEFILLVLEWPLERTLDLCHRNKFKYYAIRSIINLVKNSNSPYSKTIEVKYSYLEHDRGQRWDNIKGDFLNDLLAVEDSEPQYLNQTYAETMAGEIESFLKECITDEKLNWYDVEVFNLYNARYKSFRKMSKAANIPHSSLWHSYNRVRKSVLNQFGEEYAIISANDLEH